MIKKSGAGMGLVVDLFKLFRGQMRVDLGGGQIYMA